MALEACLGAAVLKRFGKAGWFHGTVTAFNADARLWHVSYEDGDAEELEAHELRAVLVAKGSAATPSKKKRKAADAAQQPAPKRGAPAAKADAAGEDEDGGSPTLLADDDDLAPGFVRRAAVAALQAKPEPEAAAEDDDDELPPGFVRPAGGDAAPAAAVPKRCRPRPRARCDTPVEDAALAASGAAGAPPAPRPLGGALLDDGGGGGHALLDALCVAELLHSCGGALRTPHAPLAWLQRAACGAAVSSGNGQAKPKAAARGAKLRPLFIALLRCSEEPSAARWAPLAAEAPGALAECLRRALAGRERGFCRCTEASLDSAVDALRLPGGVAALPPAAAMAALRWLADGAAAGAAARSALDARAVAADAARRAAAEAASKARAVSKERTTSFTAAMAALAEKEAGIKAQAATLPPGWQQKAYLREALTEVNTRRCVLRAAEAAAVEADGDKAERRRRALSRRLAAAAVREDCLGQDRLQRSYFRFASDPGVIYVRSAPDAADAEGSEGAHMSEGSEGVWGYVPLHTAEGDALWAALLPRGEREGRLREALTARGLERCCLARDDEDSVDDEDDAAPAPAVVALEPPCPRTTRRAAAKAAAAAPKPSNASLKAAAKAEAAKAAAAEAAAQLARDAAAPPGSPPARDALPPPDAAAVAAAMAEEEDLAAAAARSALLSLSAALAAVIPPLDAALRSWNVAPAAAPLLAKQLLEMESALYNWLAPFGAAIAADEEDLAGSNSGSDGVVNEVEESAEGTEKAVLWRNAAMREAWRAEAAAAAAAAAPVAVCAALLTRRARRALAAVPEMA